MSLRNVSSSPHDPAVQQHERALVMECLGCQLPAVLHAPDRDASNTGVVIVVGGPQYRVGSHRQFVHLARQLAVTGYATLRFDFRGMGDSEGEFAGFEHLDQDIRTAVNRLIAAIPDVKRVVLWGLCDGATAAALYAPTDDRIKGLILANPWVRSDSGQAKAYIKHYYAQRIFQSATLRRLLTGKIDYRTSIGSILHFVRKAWLTPSRRAGKTAEGYVNRMYSGLSRWTGSVLILLSGNDLTAAEFAELGASSRQWRRLLSNSRVRKLAIPLADHTFSTSRDERDMIAYTISWLESLSDFHQ